ncbi:hypothetical protein C8A05DRAFT_36490 [Staphylotrichum tortipilum]|uniref:Uncharacterized protein n=1 Tax=Staphylotrichum tortipilum TaxID=2831512 RepID=A0AAN6RRK3_9PEZI|nr:hypothetical protein C8A05DRAFT_36490 [Staphylotrichum longicolle]
MLRSIRSNLFRVVFARPLLSTPRVAEPVNIGYSVGPSTMFYFGYSFFADDAPSYNVESFGEPGLAPPEIIDQTGSTTHPLKVDS